jgi:predicted thioesterase
MKSGLRPGASREEHYGVTKELSIQVGNVAVLSTPSLVNLMELTSRLLLAPFLQDDEQSVGSSISVKHLAPTPVGGDLRVVSRVTAISGRRVDFEVEAYDQVEKVAEAAHQRYVAELSKFQERVDRKLKS